MLQNDTFRPLLTISLNGLNRTVLFFLQKNRLVLYSVESVGFFPNIELFIGRSLIKVVNKFEFLGLIFDQSLRFHRHLKDLKKCQGPKHPQSISKYSLGSRPNIFASPLQSSDKIKTRLWICGLQFCVQVSFEDLGSSASSSPETWSGGLPYITGRVALC
ncbi:hypothetical protein TNCV_4508531 [Trichonephila clavipes]|nr:hypothetical protein TNCV_4508531 [Trichonephila clavipes]